MKTIADLNALIPQLTDLVLDNPEIGESGFERDEDGWCRCDNSTTNCVCYEEDGWSIEITFESGTVEGISTSITSEGNLSSFTVIKIKGKRDGIYCIANSSASVF